MSAASHLVPSDSPSGRRSPATSRRPSLRVVPQPRSRVGRNAFGLLVGAILVAGLIAVLMLNTVLAQGAFTINQMEKDTAALVVQQQALEQQVAVLQTPESIAKRARRLGMVRPPAPVFLRLSDGKVLGDPQPAPGTPVVSEPQTPVVQDSPPAPAAVPAPEAAEQQAAPVEAAASRPVTPVASATPATPAADVATPAPGSVGDGAAVPAAEGAEDAAAADAAASASGDGATPGTAP